MSALHLSDAFYAYISDAVTSPRKSITYLTPTNDPIGLSLPSALIATEDRTDFTDSEEREAFERDTSSEKSNCSQ